MRLYDGGKAPNPRRVHVFLKEKGIEIERVQLDINALEPRSESYARLNPTKTVPALELDDGTVISETIAICRYLEELHPEPNLFGTTALEKALIEMWQRRVAAVFPAACGFCISSSSSRSKDHRAGAGCRMGRDEQGTRDGLHGSVGPAIAGQRTTLPETGSRWLTSPCLRHASSCARRVSPSRMIMGR